ncbi:transcription factor atoh8-like [Microplitis mediator]|uniref:transcription factor atoh8-like n=1 Tax=Microplitis mediator TaxID=375433 RepID=UPI00255338DF|nr:transcription factor atoh8-like [Microplitis mediator]
MNSDTCELTYIKDVMSGSEKDAGFCSGEDENLHSPSGSEDSVEVQISPISLRNKRKLAEPKKNCKSDAPNRPLKKRRFIERSTGSPFRPWSSPHPDKAAEDTQEERWRLEEERRRSEESQRLYEARIHAQVLARLQSVPSAPLPSTRAQNSGPESPTTRPHSSPVSSIPTQAPVSGPLSPVPTSLNPHSARLSPNPTARLPHSSARTQQLYEDFPHQEEPLALVLRGDARVPAHPGVTEVPYEDKRSLNSQNYDRINSNKLIPSSRMSSTSQAMSSTSNGMSEQSNPSGQRNYKNMTRERRIEANARERTRVHTISAAFNTLRKSIPAYSHNQKLSKLSVLRIACSYIMTLSKIVGEGEDELEGRDKNRGMELGECVDLVSRTIQTEGKLRKKKED